jgi:ribosome-binding factor A
MQGLKRASGFLRRELARRVRLRRTPVLNFHWDVSLSRAETVERALDNLHTPPLSPDKDMDKK